MKPARKEPPPPLPVAVSSICWARDPVETAMAKAQEAGFTAFEALLFPAEIARVHGDLREMRPATFARQLADHGLKPAALHVGAIMTPNTERCRALTDYARRAIAFAAEIGCGLVVDGGPDRATEPFVPFLRSLETLVPALEESGVRLGLENHYGNWIQFIQDYEHIFQQVDHPAIGITLDTGHFTSAGVPPEAVAEAFPERVLHVHVKDHRGTQSVPLGTGETTNAATARSLKAHGYRGYLSQELEVADDVDGDAAARSGFTYMQQLSQA